MKLCPECRARVLDDWTSCKFCGESLTGEAIGATLHPDDLVVPETTDHSEVAPTLPPPPPPGLPEGGSSPWDVSGGSSWDSMPPPPDTTSSPWDTTSSTVEDAGWASDVPEPTGTASQEAWDVPRSDDATSTIDPGTSPFAPATGQELEPLEGGGSVDWVDGPAPGEAPVVDEGPSGLEPVSWYTEPEAGGADDPGFSTHPDPSTSPKDTTGPAPLFDPNQLYTDMSEPEPASSADPVDTSVDEPGSGLAPVFQWQPAADGWATDDHADVQAAKGQSFLSRETRLLALALVLLIVVVVAFNVIRSRKDGPPSGWPRDLHAIAAFVAKDRGVDFKHPVAVEVLDPAAFDKARAEASEVTDKKTVAAFADLAAAYRALGLVGGTPDPRLASSVLTGADAGAFYDLAGQRLVVRSGKLTVSDRAAAAAALSVALDDQWADLGDLRGSVIPDTPLLAVVTGTSELVREHYLDSRPDDERATVGSDEDALLGRDAAEKDFLPALTSAPARLGFPFARLVHDVEGTKGLTEAIENPPTADKGIFQPPVFFRGASPLATAVPKVPDGATEISEGTFGTTSWYLLLATRIDQLDALDAVDGWGGDSAVVYRKPDQVVCIALTVRGVNSRTSDVFEDALRSWEKALPEDLGVEVGRNGDEISVTGCDPGADVSPGELAGAGPALDLPVVRSRLAADYYHEGTKAENGPNGALFTYDEAWCMADRMVRDHGSAEVVERRKAHDDVYAKMTLSAGKACGATLADVLFKD